MNREPTNDKAAGLGSMGGLGINTDYGTNNAGNSAAAQRSRLLDWLRKGPITTLEARRVLDILMPAARVFELRAQGFDILMCRVWQYTSTGKRHSVARYSLVSGVRHA